MDWPTQSFCAFVHIRLFEILRNKKYIYYIFAIFVMSDQYRIPTNEEKSQKQDLIGKKITIFWDGDDVYYPGVVKGYDEKDDKYSVLYDGDISGEVYTEDLVQSAWKIWAGTDEEYARQMENKVYHNIALYLYHYALFTYTYAFLIILDYFKKCYESIFQLFHVYTNPTSLSLYYRGKYLEELLKVKLLKRLHVIINLHQRVLVLQVR